MKPTFLFPGQGSQFVGMGRDFYSEFETVRELFQEVSALLEMNLVELCFEGPEATLVRTDNVQPAVTLVNIACMRVLGEAGIEPVAAAGHSLGEYAALHSAGVLSLRDTMLLVRNRGKFMNDAAKANPGGMIAVMGLPLERVVEICEQAKERGSIAIANHNSASQSILTGVPEALDTATELARKAGPVLVVPLKVSGPWHSPMMRPASVEMERELGACEMHLPAIPVVSNVTGDYFGDTADIRHGLVQQIVQPVKWVSCIERLIASGQRLFVEVGPGHMLAGLMRDIDKSVKVLTMESVADFEKLKNYLADAAQSDE